MIKAVLLDISPEMLEAINEHRKRDNCLEDAWIENVGHAGREREWEITADKAADWCESWFGSIDLNMIIENEKRVCMEYPECCEDPLVKDFVETILKIYRLTVSV